MTIQAHDPWKAAVRTLHLGTHPEATHVVDGLVGGWYDADLTERGEVDAEAVAAELASRLQPALAAGEQVGVVSSDLRRCRRTAERLLAGPAEHLVVVTHGGAATYVVTAWIGMPLESVGSVRFTTPPGAITVLRQDADTGDRRVASLGEVAHLGPRGPSASYRREHPAG